MQSEIDSIKLGVEEFLERLSGMAFAVVGSEADKELCGVYSEELALLSPGASARRERQFALGRIAAHQALEKIGFSPSPSVLRSENREPLWPVGVVGSISHSDEFGVAVVASSELFSSLGVDIQRLRSDTELDVAKRVALKSESDWIFQGRTRADMCERLTLLFSAKESAFKLLYPLVKQFVGFRDVEFIWDEADRCFRGTLLKDFPDGLKSGEVVKIETAVVWPFVLTCGGASKR